MIHGDADTFGNKPCWCNHVARLHATIAQARGYLRRCVTRATVTVDIESPSHQATDPASEDGPICQADIE
jgi:hypothetical protein